jgi:hypothetical protein
MADLQTNLNQVKSNESFLEKIKRYIPGYDGYVNRDNSRELDTILRNTLATNLDNDKLKIKNIMTHLNSTGKLFEAVGIDKIDKKLENAIAKLKSAARGYSGAFDVVKIKDEKLTQIYNFDAALLDEVNEINNSFTELETVVKSNTDFKDNIEKVSRLIDNLLVQFDEREGILRNL